MRSLSVPLASLATKAVTLVGLLASPVGAAALMALALPACNRTSEPTQGAPDGSAKAAKPSNESNDLVIPAASVSAAVNPANLPPYTGPTGIVEGTVLVKGPDAPDVPNLNVHNCPAAIDTYGKLFRAGPPRADGTRPLADAVVAVTGYAGAYIPVTNNVKRVAIQPNCGYRERTITATYGQRIEVVNDSKLPFAPFLDGVQRPAVMIAPPEQNGDPVKIYPPSPGHYNIRDEMQPFVKEDVYVLLQPLHTVTDLTGHFRIEGVPVGKLKVGAQLGAISSQTQTDVEVLSNVVANVELVLTYTPKPVVPWDGGWPKIIP
jgi:hypothetical protein